MHADATDYMVETTFPDGGLLSVFLSEAQLSSMIADRVQQFVVKPGCGVEVTEGKMTIREGDDITTITWINAEYI